MVGTMSTTLAAVALVGSGSVAATSTPRVVDAGYAGTGPIDTKAVFDVRDFGAGADDDADDAPAFRDAVAAADAAGGGTVYIPGGTFLLARTSQGRFGMLDLTGVSGVEFLGDGPVSRVKLRPRDWTPFEEPSMFWCDGCSAVSYRDLLLDGSRHDPGMVGKEQMHGVVVSGSVDTTFERVTFEDLVGDGVRSRGELNALTENLVVRDSTFLGNGRSGISVQGGVRQAEFVDSHFEGTSDQDIDFEPTGNRPGPEDITIEGNTMVRVDALPLSVIVAGQNVAHPAKRIDFVGNTINDGAVSFLRTADVVVEHNTITNTGVIPTLHVGGVTGTMTVRNNTLQRGSASGPVVNIARDPAANLGTLVLETNEIHATGGDGVWLRQDSGPLIIRGNELTGSDERYGINFELPVDDGLTRHGVEISGNSVQHFAGAAVRLQTQTPTGFGVVTICGNTVDEQTTGVDLVLDGGPGSLEKAVVCDNVWAPAVTTPVTTNAVTHFRGTGTPEGVVAAPVGSEYVRSDEADRLYVKQTGTGSAGWVGAPGP